MRKKTVHTNPGYDNLAEALEELSRLRQKVKKLERDNKLLSITNINSEKLREFHVKEKSLQYLYNDLLLKHTPNMLFVFNNDLRLVLCSQSSINFLLYNSVNDILNLPLPDVFTNFVDPVWIDKIVAQCKDCLKTYAHLQYNDEISFVREGFDPINAQISIAPVIDEHNNLRGVVISIADITELTKMKEKAEAAASMKSAFLASMSHEIRTPMNAVKGLSELLLMTQLNDVQRDYVRKIVSSSNSLLHILSDILDFSKIEAGKIDILLAEYTLRDVINEVTSVINLRAAEKNLLFLVDIDPDLPAKLNGDEVRIKQIITNLLSNAVKYTPQGSIVLSVQGDVLGDTLNLRIAVQDSGIGIQSEELPYIFEAFKRSDLHTNKTIMGTGLGLTITKELVEAMHGHIRVKSKYGEGCTFTVSLPQFIVDKSPIAKVLADDIGTVLIFTPEDRAENIRSMLASLALPSIYCRTPDQVLALSNITRQSITHCLYHETYTSQFSEKIKAILPKCTSMVIKDIRQALDQSGEASLTFFEPLLVTDLTNALNKIAASSPEGERSRTTCETAKGLVGKKALIVDDNDINLMVGGSLIESYGLDVTTASSGQEALTACQKTQFDIIFMDHMMVGLNGIETTVRIRAEEGPNHLTPIIALTANVLKEVQEDFYASGMNDFIAKPIDIGELYRVLVTWVLPHEEHIGSQPQFPAKPRPFSPGAPNSTPLEEQTLSFDLFDLLDDFGMYASDVLRELDGCEAKYIERLAWAEQILGPLVKKLKNIESYEEWHAFAAEITKLRDLLHDIGARDCAGRARNLALLSKNKDKSGIHTEFTSLMGNMYMLEKKLEALVPVLYGQEESVPINDKRYLTEKLDKLREALIGKNAEKAMGIVDMLASASFNKVLDSHVNSIKKKLEANQPDEALKECLRAQKDIL